MPKITVNGAELHYQSLGEAHASDSPIVMLHGLLLGNMATWYFGAASSLARSHRVLVYDLRGHGMSSKAKDGYTLHAMVDDLKALLDSQEIDKASLVGHSYGALVSLHFTLRYPQRVQKLVLVECPLPPARGMQMEAFLGLDPAAMSSSLPDTLQAVIGRDSRQSRKLIQRLQFLAAETDLLAQLKAEKDVRNEDLATLQMPIQLIYGKSSQLADVGKRLGETMPNAALHWLDGGHYLSSEQPVLLGQTIGDFFA